jgi:hypothetical protein
LIVNVQNPTDTAFPSIDLGHGHGSVHEVDQVTGELVSVLDDAPDVSGFQLYFLEGQGRMLCWPSGNTSKTNALGV